MTTRKCQQHNNAISSQTKHYIKQNMFNMVQLELVDWEEIFQQIRGCCTFNPFIVCLFSSFALSQQKLNTVTHCLHTLHTILNTSIFNIVQLVDWEEIFQQIRVWCTFNPFIVYLFSSFAFFQQKSVMLEGA